MSAKEIRLILITGFLGSGKTSVINNLLDQLKEKSVGLILNDFGAIAVDSALVDASGSVVGTKSLSGGQIFCSCLSGSFISSVEEMVAMEPDIILVEASGLAKPAPLLEIISVIRKRTQQCVSFGGMLCVVDADRYTLLSAALKTLEEQIMFSDWFILNKTDLVDETTLASVKERVSSLRPLAPLFPTTFGRVSEELLELLLLSTPHREELPSEPAAYRGWGVNGRPKTGVFLPLSPCKKSDMEQFVSSLSSEMLRMKGFLPVDSGSTFLVDAVGPHVSISQVSMPEGVEPGIVCIWGAEMDGISKMKELWESISHSPAEIRKG